MNPAPDTLPEEKVLVCLGCSHLVEIPAGQLRDFYRGQRLVALACACACCVVLLCTALSAG